MSTAPTNTLPACAIPVNPSPQLRTALAWIEGFNTWNIDLIAEQLSSEQYEHRILPASLNQPVRNKEQYVQYFRGVMLPMFKEFKVCCGEFCGLSFVR
jgi:molybdopterin biosynthesis enzyme